MILYHGSNVEVRSPMILVTDRALDFGSGFYTTSSLEQAERWAKLQATRRKTGSPIVSLFELDESRLGDIRILRFDFANGNWLDFVSQNRRNAYSGRRFDLAIGPVANDNTMPVVAAYMAGRIDQQTALTLLKPQKLKDQYAFLSAASLNLIEFCEVRHV